MFVRTAYGTMAWRGSGVRVPSAPPSNPFISQRFSRSPVFRSRTNGRSCPQFDPYRFQSLDPETGYRRRQNADKLESNELQLRGLVRQAAPSLLELPRVGPVTAAVVITERHLTKTLHRTVIRGPALATVSHCSAVGLASAKLPIEPWRRMSSRCTVNWPAHR